MATLREWLIGDGLDSKTVAAYRARAMRSDGADWLALHGLPPLHELLKDIDHTTSVNPATAGSQQKTKKPTLVQSALTLASVMAQTAKRGALLDETAIAARLAICQSCEHFTGTSCKLCGCGCGGAKKLTNKLAHAASECPAGKWGPVE